MSNLPSHKKYRDFCSKSHITEDLRKEFSKYRYELGIYLDLSDSIPSYTHLRINTCLNDKKYYIKKAIILNRELSREKFSKVVNSIPDKISYSRDIKHLGELIFLLAAKLKYDLLSGKNKDNAGFLHTGDFERLNPLGNQAGHIKKTPLGKSVYRTLSKFKPSVKNHQSNHVNSEQHSFLLSFFDEPVQLFHLICYLGCIKKNTESYFWWLNVSPESITFVDVNTNKKAAPQLLKGKLQNLFKDSLLEDKSLSRYVESIEDFCISENKIKRLPPITPFTPQLKYFRDMRDVLKWNDEKATPQWFRKSGPIAADFLVGYMCERKELLKEIDKLVTKNKISLVKGDGGTGKSVLVRNYAYNLLKKDETQLIYHYSFKTDSQISDVHEFLFILNNLSGLVIIEDIHLAAQDVQFILDGFTMEDGCHLLLTSRPSLAESSISCYSNRLENLPEFTLMGSEMTDEIVDAYIKYNTKSEVPWTGDIKQAILDISEDNLWLLSYAIKGCAQFRGEGDSISWMKESVMQDLRDLENHNLYKCNPEILLALSPLSMSEVLTAQTFLINELHYTREDIDKLVNIGEVIKQNVGGNIFYGLQHSSLATAYWRYGDDYRAVLKYPDYENFLYIYTISGAPNAIKGCYGKYSINISLLNRLAIGKSICPIINQNSDKFACLDLCKNIVEPVDMLHPYYSSQEFKDFLRDACFKKVTIGEFITFSELFCLKLYELFWNSSWRSAFINQIYCNRHFGLICRYLSEISSRDLKVRSDILEVIDFDRLALRINSENNLRGITFAILFILKIAPEKVGSFWKKLNKERITALINARKENWSYARTLCKKSEIIKLDILPLLDKNLIESIINNDNA